MGADGSQRGTYVVPAAGRPASPRGTSGEPHGNTGATERNSCVAGATSRGELALLISTIGNADSEAGSNLFSSSAASLPLTVDGTSVSGERLPAGSLIRLADGLQPADRDLGLRLPNHSPRAWWGLELYSPQQLTGGGVPVAGADPGGRLDPVLVDPLGTPVVAAWIPSKPNMRWYILPDKTDWDAVTT